ncbi:transposase [Kitasatospora sp. NBC_00240]|uniref:transposase n=1 Tax=Kitasatospora sp. NBC_00240 TaxID=2903567 RepID=UPI002258C53F|nr:transposase [Kitasatospora sp. NBC_00240]MCX5215380.1 transposase [Kitasatospora sp. NBC_00240]
MRGRKVITTMADPAAERAPDLVDRDFVAASVQDRAGARRPLLWTRLDHPGVRKIWADQGFAGRLVDWTAQILGRDLEIVRKDPGQRGFQVQPKRWAVERTLSWITTHRRLARDYETSPARSETMIRWAMIGIMVRRLARGGPASRPGPRPLARTSV